MSAASELLGRLRDKLRLSRDGQLVARGLAPEDRELLRTLRRDKSRRSLAMAIQYSTPI